MEVIQKEAILAELYGPFNLNRGRHSCLNQDYVPVVVVVVVVFIVPVVVVVVGVTGGVKGARSGVVLSLSSRATAISPKPTTPRLTDAATEMPPAALHAPAASAPPEAPSAACRLVEPRVSKPTTPMAIAFFLESNHMPNPHFLFWSITRNHQNEEILYRNNPILPSDISII